MKRTDSKDGLPLWTAHAALYAGYALLCAVLLWQNWVLRQVSADLLLQREAAIRQGWKAVEMMHGQHAKPRSVLLQQKKN